MAVVQDRSSSRAGRRSTLTWELLLEAAFVVSQSLVLATIHSFTVVTLSRLQVTYLFYGVILPEVDPWVDSTALAPS